VSEHSGDSEKTNQRSEHRGDSDKTNQSSEYRGDSDKANQRSYWNTWVILINKSEESESPLYSLL
jgi:hypothetical protein